MKRSVLSVLLVVMLVWIGCSQDKGPAIKASGVADQLPAATEAFVRISSLGAVYESLGITPTTVLGQPINNVGAISEMLKLNPFDQEALRQAGFATDKPLTLAFSDITIDDSKDAPNFNLLLMVPVTDGVKAVQYLEETVRASKEQADLKTTDGITTFTPSPNDGPLFWTVKGDQLLVAGNPQTSALEFLKGVLAGETSLAKNERFKDVAKRVDLSKDLALYIDVGGLLVRNKEIVAEFYKQSTQKSERPGQPIPDMSRGLSYLADYEGTGVAIDLSSPHMALDSATLIKDQSPLLNVVKDVAIDRDTLLGQKANPVLMFAMAFNLAEYVNLLQDMFDDQFKKTMTAGMAQVQEQTGIDPQTEIIDNLGGNLNLGIFDGASVTMANLNALLTLSIKDQAKALATLDKAIQQLPPDKQRFVTQAEIEGIPTFQVNLGAAQLYLGVTPTQMIATVGKPMYEKAQQAKMADGFVAKLEDQDLVRSMKKSSSLVYLDFAEVSYVANTLGAFAQKNPKARDGFDKAMALFKEFDYLLLSSHLEGRAVLGKMILHTKFQEPFAIRLAQIIESWQTAPAPAATQ